MSLSYAAVRAVSAEEPALAKCAVPLVNTPGIRIVVSIPFTATSQAVDSAMASKAALAAV